MKNKPTYNPNIHHRRSIRLKGYDYAQAGLYFITICCQNRAHLFGEIINGQMILNDAGKIANNCWMEIPNHFPNAVLHEHIVMPNHIHGIIELKYDTVGAEKFPPDNVNVIDNDRSNNDDAVIDNDRSNNDDAVIDNDRANNDDAVIDNDRSNNDDAVIDNDWANNDDAVIDNDRANNHSPLRSPSKTIGSIVRGFKIGVTKRMRQNTDVYHVWQRNYYEHIIRKEQSYLSISEYIINNPTKWENDKFYKQ